MQLVLCSSSEPRRLLLKRLQIPFEVSSPDVDETPYPGERVQELVVRLAEEKAKVHLQKFPDSLLIGCDQVASVDNFILGKPKTHAHAIDQLLQCSGKKVEFLVGIALFNTRSQNIQKSIVRTETLYRKLSPDMIESYLQREKPYHCAGSVKGEALGIALFEQVISDDPTALIGLPLITLIKMLENESVKIL